MFIAKLEHSDPAQRYRKSRTASDENMPAVAFAVGPDELGSRDRTVRF